MQPGNPHSIPYRINSQLVEWFVEDARTTPSALAGAVSLEALQIRKRGSVDSARLEVFLLDGVTAQRITASDQGKVMFTTGPQAVFGTTNAQTNSYKSVVDVESPECVAKTSMVSGANGGNAFYFREIIPIPEVALRRRNSVSVVVVVRCQLATGRESILGWTIVPVLQNGQFICGDDWLPGAPGCIVRSLNSSFPISIERPSSGSKKVVAQLALRVMDQSRFLQRASQILNFPSPSENATVDNGLGSLDADGRSRRASQRKLSSGFVDTYSECVMQESIVSVSASEFSVATLSDVGVVCVFDQSMHLVKRERIRGQISPASARISLSNSDVVCVASDSSVWISTVYALQTWRKVEGLNNTSSEKDESEDAKSAAVNLTSLSSFVLQGSRFILGTSRGVFLVDADGATGNWQLGNSPAGSQCMVVPSRIPSDKIPVLFAGDRCIAILHYNPGTKDGERLSVSSVLPLPHYLTPTISSSDFATSDKVMAVSRQGHIFAAAMTPVTSGLSLSESEKASRQHSLVVALSSTQDSQADRREIQILRVQLTSDSSGAWRSIACLEGNSLVDLQSKSDGQVSAVVCASAGSIALAHIESESIRYAAASTAAPRRLQGPAGFLTFIVRGENDDSESVSYVACTKYLKHTQSHVIRSRTHL